MPTHRMVQSLNDQVAAELAAAHQYTAVAVHYDARSLPRLARLFYAQAAEERTHGMMMVRYLLDRGAEVRLGEVPAPQVEFADHIAPILLALDQERSVTGQISRLVEIARDDRDLVSEQFLQWFLREQVEEEAKMSEVLDVAERVRESPMTLEDYLAREYSEPEPEDPTAPPAAGER